jgi:hypothetical protein
METTTTPAEYDYYPGVPASIVDAIEDTGQDFIGTDNGCYGAKPVTMTYGMVTVDWEAEGDPDGTLYRFDAYTNGDVIYSGSMDAGAEIFFDRD